MSETAHVASPHIRVDLADAIYTIRFDRPAKKNALTIAMYERIVAALAEAAADEAVRVVRFIGAPGAYTAGNDLSDFLSRPPTAESPVVHLLFALAVFPKPMVAAVDGAAVGLGTTMLLHCDLVVATERARFQMPFVKLGLVPEAASSLLLPMVAGLQRASEWLLLGEPFTVEEARAGGLVNRVVAPEALEAESMALCLALASRPVQAVRATKALIRGPLADAVDHALWRETRRFGELLHTPEAMEAFINFLQRR